MKKWMLAILLMAMIAVTVSTTGCEINKQEDNDMSKSKFVQANEKIADAVVGGYKKIENGVVGAYKKVEDGFVDQFLTHEGETVEDAKKRLHDQQTQREAAARASVEVSKNAGKK